MISTPATYGPPIRWLADDGGWRTGRLVYCPDGSSWPYVDDDGETLFLIREDCGGQLTWVREDALMPWQTREERGE